MSLLRQGRKNSGIVDNICSGLPWDSGFFKLRIARFSPTYLTPDSLNAALDWCRSNEIDCLYFLAASDHPETVRLAETAGFQFVDIRVTLVRETGSQGSGDITNRNVRPFQESDLQALQEIAAYSHEDSRFFYDAAFPRERCRALFETWIERSCHGWAQAVFVAEVDGVPSGYCTCHIEGNAGTIGLVALGPHAQGRGLGRHLVEAALSYFRQHKVPEVTVVTQGRNCKAQRLYQRCGFVTQSAMLWYHKWLRHELSDR